MKAKLFGGRGILRATLALAATLAATQAHAAFNVTPSGSGITISDNGQRNVSYYVSPSAVSPAATVQSSYVQQELSSAAIGTQNLTYTADAADEGSGTIKLIQRFTNNTGKAITSITLQLLGTSGSYQNTTNGPSVGDAGNFDANDLPGRYTRVEDITPFSVKLLTITFDHLAGGVLAAGESEDMFVSIGSITRPAGPTLTPLTFTIAQTVEAVPEPATLTMCGIFGLTAAGAGYLKKRRKGAAVA